MTWTTPPTVVTGQIYTAAMFNTYTRDNSIHLRAILPDPPSINRALVSDGTTTASFRLLPDAAILNPKVNQILASSSASSFAGAFSFQNGFILIDNGASNIADAPYAATQAMCLQIAYSTSLDYRVQFCFGISQDAQIWIRWVLNGSPTAWAKVWHGRNDGDTSGLDADTIRGLIPGNNSGNIAFNNASMNINLNAQYLQSYVPGNGAGSVLAINNSVLNSGLNADMVDTHHAADLMPNEGRIYFQTVAQLTAAGAHWTRDTASNGRMVLPADEGGAIPFAPDNNYGNGWTPVTGLGTSVGGVPASGGPFITLLQGTVSSGLIPTVSHTHPAPAVNLTGQGAFWMPPSRAYVLARKI